MKIIRFIGNVLLILTVSLFALTAAISFYSAPEDDGLFGFKGYTVVSGSMEPTFSTGDFIFVQTVDMKDMKENDIATFARDGDIVTHRVIEMSGNSFMTKGDANNIQDQGVVTEEDLVGKLTFVLPYFGYVVVATQQPFVFISLAVLLGLYFIFTYVKSTKEEKQQAKG